MIHQLSNHKTVGMTFSVEASRLSNKICCLLSPLQITHHKVFCFGIPTGRHYFSMTSKGNDIVDKHCRLPYKSLWLCDNATYSTFCSRCCAALTNVGYLHSEWKISGKVENNKTKKTHESYVKVNRSWITSGQHWNIFPENC